MSHKTMYIISDIFYICFFLISTLGGIKSLIEFVNMGNTLILPIMLITYGVVCTIVGIVELAKDLK